MNDLQRKENVEYLKHSEKIMLILFLYYIGELKWPLSLLSKMQVFSFDRNMNKTTEESIFSKLLSRS